MRYKLIYAAILLLFLFCSCCSDVSRNDQKENNTTVNNSNPQSVQINKSIVKIQVKSIDQKGESDFTIKGVVLYVIEDPAYPSMAIQNEVYLLTPGFVLDPQMNIEPENERNKDLISLAGLVEGDEFDAVISFNKTSGWIINEVIRKE